MLYLSPSRWRAGRVHVLVGKLRVVKVTPAICVDGAANTVRMADFAAGECDCDKAVWSGESLGVPLAFRRRDATCAAVLARASPVYPPPPAAGPPWTPVPSLSPLTVPPPPPPPPPALPVPPPPPSAPPRPPVTVPVLPQPLFPSPSPPAEVADVSVGLALVNVPF